MKRRKTEQGPLGGLGETRARAGQELDPWEAEGLYDPARLGLRVSNHAGHSRHVLAPATSLHYFSTLEGFAGSG